MVKHLTRHGNSAALVIDKAVLELLHITMKTPLKLVTDGNSLIISPVRSISHEKHFRAALEVVNKRHGKTLKKLSK